MPAFYWRVYGILSYPFLSRHFHLKKFVIGLSFMSYPFLNTWGIQTSFLHPIYFQGQRKLLKLGVQAAKIRGCNTLISHKKRQNIGGFSHPNTGGECEIIAPHVPPPLHSSFYRKQKDKARQSFFESFATKHAGIYNRVFHHFFKQIHTETVVLIVFQDLKSKSSEKLDQN